MGALTPQERVLIIKTFYENDSSIVKTERKLRYSMGVHRMPSAKQIQRVVTNFEVWHSLEDIPKPKRAWRARTQQNIEAIRESVGENPGISVRARAQEVGVSPTTVWKVLKSDLQKQSPETVQKEEPCGSVDEEQFDSTDDSLSEEEFGQDLEKETDLSNVESVKLTPTSSDCEAKLDEIDVKLRDEELTKFGEDLTGRIKGLSKVDGVKLMLQIQELVTETRLKYLETEEEDRPNLVQVWTKKGGGQ